METNVTIESENIIMKRRKNYENKKKRFSQNYNTGFAVYC